mmetsp:Transcript_8914/g.22503  ORF Transcript_8914/g.22503 Transcript_8914/m.22503 type:complete len:90 (-) Transcript_8914:426-695(-)
MFMMEQPSHSHRGPQHPSGRHGADGLQHICKFKQQSPILPEQPTQSASLYEPQLTQPSAQQRTMFSSSTASSRPIFVWFGLLDSSLFGA